MTKSRYLHYLLYVSLCLSVLFTSVLISSRLVHASSDIPSTNWTYDLYYRNDNNSWVNITANNGVDGLTPNRDYECRIRINLDNVIDTDEGRNISVVFNHSTGNIPNFTVTPAQSNGYTITSSTYDKLEVINNSARTKTTFNVYNLRSPTYTYLYINFIFSLPSTTVSSSPTNGFISIGVPTVEIEELSLEQQLQSLFANISNKLTDVQTTLNNNNTALINNNNSNTNGILGGLSSLGSTITGGLSSLGSSILGGLTSLGSTITGAISTAVDTLLSGIQDGLTFLFVPDGDDLQDFLDDFKDEVMEENEMFGGVIGIFTDLFDTINTNQVQDTIHIPEFTFTVNDTDISVGNWDMRLFPIFDGSDTILGYVRLFTSIVVGVWLLNMVFSYLLFTLGIGNSEEVVDE